MRKGMMLGKGRGYKNIIGRDPFVHSQSGKGIKQPQRMPYFAVNPALAKYSNAKLQEGAVKEHIEHPKFSMSQARQIAKDHLTDNPRAYGKWKYGDRELTSLKTLEEQRIAKFRNIARKKDIDPVLFEEFMMRAFPDAMCGYEEEWADRFKKGNPMKYMDSNTLRIYKEVIKDYEEKYFHHNGGKGGKFSVTSKNALTFKDKNGILITIDSPKNYDEWDNNKQIKYLKKIEVKNDSTFVSDNIKASLKGGKAYNLKINAQIDKKKYKGDVKLKLPDNGAFGGKMSKKDYEAFAKIFGTSKDKDELKGRIFEFIVQDNPKFDRGRFYKAEKKWQESADK